jgi:hypothetical protein
VLQPAGVMCTEKLALPLPGHTRVGSYRMTFRFASGVQTPEMPSPGKRHAGDHRNAFLPDT